MAARMCRVTIEPTVADPVSDTSRGHGLNGIACLIDGSWAISVVGRLFPAVSYRLRVAGRLGVWVPGLVKAAHVEFLCGSFSMKCLSRFSRFSAAALFALLIATALGVQSQSQPTELQRGLLYADLWVQTSAEYVACCLQTYQLAGEHLEHEMARLHAEQARQAADLPTLPPAVIMDLDETVLDNATFQTFLYDSGQNYADDLFIKFVSDNRKSIRLVPGAKDFIDHAEALGVTVSYITNREEPLRQATIETLAQWGINVRGLDDPKGVRLLLAAHGESIKKPRRDLVARSIMCWNCSAINWAISATSLPPTTTTPPPHGARPHTSTAHFGERAGSCFPIQCTASGNRCYAANRSKDLAARASKHVRRKCI